MTAEERDRELWLEERKAALIRVMAIEKRFPTSTITLVINRDEAKKLGLLIESTQTI